MSGRKVVLERLGGNIRKLRKRAKLSQERLALEAGLDRTYVGGVERGERNVGVLNLCRIANALRVPVSELLLGIVDEGEEKEDAR